MYGVGASGGVGRQVLVNGPPTVYSARASPEQEEFGFAE